MVDYLTSSQNTGLSHTQIPRKLDMKRDVIISESWNRSYAAKVNQSDGCGYNVLENYAIKNILTENHNLLEITKPLMHNIYELVKNSGCILVLTDAKGHVLDSFGDREVVNEAQQINFIPGARWLEGDVGTNAIGTAFAVGIPIQIIGSEHYCQKQKDWSCSASPVFDQDDQMIGIVDISGYSNTLHPHSLGMAAVLANMINMKLRVIKMNQKINSFNHKLSKLFDKMSDGLIELDRNDCIIHLNPVVKTILDKPERDIIGKPIGKILNVDLPTLVHTQYEESLIVKNKDHQQYQIFIEPFMDKDSYKNGRIILFKKISDTKKLFKRGLAVETLYNFEDIIGQSQIILDIKHKAALAAHSAANIILEGESGTGKELFAQSIHRNSARKEGPFVAVNCGAIPQQLIASELFGYDEGAFTSAKRGGRAGKFEQANGGTLFLDEVGEMPLDQQVALLRVLQEKKLSRLGSNQVIPIDMRIICASNKSLHDAMVRGNFRQDLYFRLNVLTIQIPPLRNRRDDIQLLFKYFLHNHEIQLGRELPIDPKIFPFLENYQWPGNVRELQNIVERIVCLAEDSQISFSSLPEEIHSQTASPFLDLPPGGYCDSKEERQRKTSENERKKILLLLDKNGGNVSLTAREMGISRNTLYRKLRTYQISN